MQVSMLWNKTISDRRWQR